MIGSRELLSQKPRGLEWTVFMFSDPVDNVSKCRSGTVCYRFVIELICYVKKIFYTIQNNN